MYRDVIVKCRGPERAENQALGDSYWRDPPALRGLRYRQGLAKHHS